MPSERRNRLPSGRQPYDPLIGARVGGLGGGVLGAVATAATSISNAWLVLVGAVVGGAIGYRVERRGPHSANRQLPGPDTDDD